MIDNQIILISYPSGGFGNFLYHVLTEFADNTHKVSNSTFAFNLNGNSHATQKYMTPYFFEPADYQIVLPKTNAKCLVLCDNGIINDSYIVMRQVFPTAQIVRACITTEVRPVIYKTCVVKAQQSDVLSVNQEFIQKNWSDTDPYTQREFFTLMYHDWKFGWRPSNDVGVLNLDLESLICDPVGTITEIITQIGGAVTDHNGLVECCAEWSRVNSKYFKIYHDWLKIRAALEQDSDADISDIVDLHDQGYINYCIERDYHVTIPVYDYRDWFTSTTQIKEMIQCLK